MASQMIPGQNYDYQQGVPFYTLQAEDGRFLSNPHAIIQEQWHVDGFMKDTNSMANSELLPQDVIAMFEAFDPPARVNVATSKDCMSAWVVYSLPELRQLYKVLSYQRARMKREGNADIMPSIPVTGILKHDDVDAWRTVCPQITRLADREFSQSETIPAPVEATPQAAPGSSSIPSALDWSQAPDRLKKRRSGRRSGRALPSANFSDAPKQSVHEKLHELSRSLSASKTGNAPLRRNRRKDLPSIPSELNK